MESDKESQATRVERLTQLADLLRQGVLSDEEYEAAVARVMEASTPPRPDQTEGSTSVVLPPSDHQNTARSADSQEAHDWSTARPRQPKGSSLKIGALIVGGVVILAGVGYMAFGSRDPVNTASGPPLQTFDLTGVYSGDVGPGWHVTFYFGEDHTWTTQPVDANGTWGPEGGFGSGTWKCEGEPPICTLVDPAARENLMDSGYSYHPDKIKVENGSLYFVYFDGSGHELLTPGGD